MARPTGWDILGLDGDPTPGVVESVQALAKEFGDFAHDVEAAYHSLNSFGGDANALQWVGQTADAFKSKFGPLPGRLQKLYTSYSEASDALSAYWPQLQAAQTKADSALRQAQDAHADLQRATTSATNAAADLKTAQQNQAANPNQQAVTDAQTAHDTAQTNLNNAKAKMAALTKQANDAYNDRINAAKTCGSALHHAQSDGIHNKSWWQHVGEDLSKWGGEIGKIAGELAPILDIIALATSWIPGVDVVTAALAEIDNIVAIAGTAMGAIGDAMQGHWGDALLGAGMLALTFVGGRALGSGAEDLEGEAGALEGEAGALDAAEDPEAELANQGQHVDGNGESNVEGDPVDVVSGQMIVTETDLVLPGILPLELNRAYASGYRTGRLFGPGWSSTLDQRLAINEAGVHFAGDDAQTLHYPLPQSEASVLPAAGARWPLTWDRRTDEIRISDPVSGQTRHFSAVHYRDESGEIRDLTAISDRNGNRIAVERDGSGTPLAVVHSGGYRLAVDTVGNGADLRLVGIRFLADESDHEGELVREYTYDTRGRLIANVDAIGHQYRYEYDDADRITAWVDRVGFRYEYQYDQLGRVERAVGQDGVLSAAFIYDRSTRTTSVTDSLGAATHYQYDRHGRVERITNMFGQAVSYEFDEAGRLLRHVDRQGRITTYALDARGNRTRIARPDGSVITSAYDDDGNPVRITEPDGATWLYRYDNRGNLLAVTDPLGLAKTFTYDEFGRMTSSTDELGNTTSIEADAAGLWLRITEPDGACRSAERDARGQVVAITDALGAIERFTWNGEGRRTSRTHADGGVESWQWDPMGNLIRYVDQAGNSTELEIGPFRQVVARVDPDGSRHRFDYDTELQLRAVLNPRGQSWDYRYDEVGNLVGESDFNGRSLSYEYDSAGRLMRRTAANGDVIEYERDAMGRAVVQRASDGQAITTQYDSCGRRTSIGDGASEIVYHRDALGRVVSESTNGRTVNYLRDAAGRRVSLTTPSGRTTNWSYDAAGRSLSLQAGSESFSFSYDAAGRESHVQFSPKAALTNEWDSTGRLARRRVLQVEAPASSGRAVLEQAWSYRTDGSPVAVFDSETGSRTLDIDSSGRVTAVHGATWTENYAYDASGAVVQANDTRSPDGPTAGPRTIAGTLIRQAGRTSYDYDASGRLVRTVRRTLSGSRKIWAYAYDAFDRLIEVQTPSGDTWRYRYDPLGRRIAKERFDNSGAPVTQVRFSWDGPLVAEEEVVQSADARIITTNWDYRPGTWTPVAQEQRTSAPNAPQHLIDRQFHAIITDLVGAPSELVTVEGQVEWRRDQGLFGGLVGEQGAQGVRCPLRFPGQYHDDETGLDYNIYRYYDASTARYTTPDPLGLAPAPDDHAYVPNPMVWADPLGLSGGSAAPGGGSGHPIWSSTNSKTGVENAYSHFQKHGGEFEDIQNAKQYVESANDFLDSSDPNVLTRYRYDQQGNVNGVVRYDPATEEFGVKMADGTPRTYFKPDPAQHGYATNRDYFYAQGQP